MHGPHGHTIVHKGHSQFGVDSEVSTLVTHGDIVGCQLGVGGVVAHLVTTIPAVVPEGEDTQHVYNGHREWAGGATPHEMRVFIVAWSTHTCKVKVKL